MYYPLASEWFQVLIMFKSTTFINTLLKALIAVFLFSTVQAQAAPLGADMPNYANMYKHGEAERNILFWTLYRAELYSNQTNFDKDSYPQALKLTYLHDIGKQRLINSMQKQWRKLGSPVKNETQWMLKLNQLWPAVDKNQAITIIVDADKISHFYLINADKTRHLGNIEDPTFGSTFLAIWLAENTPRPEMRSLLMGTNEE